MISDFAYDHIVGLTVVGIVIVLFTSVGLPLFIQWNPGEQKLTGYIYSVGDEWGIRQLGILGFQNMLARIRNLSSALKRKIVSF